LYIIKDKKEILVMKTTKIKCDEVFDTKDFNVKLFGDKEIKNREDFRPKADEELKAKTSEEIARYFFEVYAANDWKKVEKVAPFLTNSKAKEYLVGLEIIEIGKSFQSGTYKGYFVP
jgi:ATP-dependent exoDNAse (exonuclease V) alpha subunit